MVVPIFGKDWSYPNVMSNKKFVGTKRKTAPAENDTELAVNLNENLCSALFGIFETVFSLFKIYIVDRYSSVRVNLFLISKSCFGIRVFSEMGALKRQQKDPHRAKAYFEAAQSLKNYPKVLIVLNFGYCYYWS